MMDDIGREAAADLFFGQIVIIWARWFVIIAGAILTLWTARGVAELSVAILPIIALMALNCYLHGRACLERPANQRLLLTVGLLDLLLITASILSWGGQGGLASPAFLFYYPLLLAVACVFPPRLSAIATGLTLLAYTTACLLAAPALLGSAAESKTLVVRLLTLAAVGGLGTFYWRIQRARRRATAAAHPPFGHPGTAARTPAP
jgi:hypothetical protein